LANKISRFSVLNGVFKLRQVHLGYTISERALGNIPVFRAIQISLVGRNLLNLYETQRKYRSGIRLAFPVLISGIEVPAFLLPDIREINANFKFKK